MFKRMCVILALCLHTLTWGGGVVSKERNLLQGFMQARFKLSTSSSTSIFDALRKFSPIKYQQGGVGQEQNVEPVPPIPPEPPVPPDRTYEIGEFAEGGVVIWVTDDKKHGLVASIVNLGSPAYTLTWGLTHVLTNATNNEPLPSSYTNLIPKENYSGYQNQQIIEAINGWESNYPAFAACKNYSITIAGKTYDDWFLPTSTELQQISDQREIVSTVSIAKGGQALFTNTTDPGGSIYWSSREFENYSTYAWLLNFFNGFQTNNFKGNPCAVRCVRAF